MSSCCSHDEPLRISESLQAVGDGEMQQQQLQDPDDPFRHGTCCNCPEAAAAAAD